MPQLVQLAEQMRRRGDELILLSVGDVDETRDFIAQFGFRGLVVTTTYETPVVDQYKVIGAPMYYLIDRRGIIQAAGFVGADAWQALIGQWD